VPVGKITPDAFRAGWRDGPNGRYNVNGGGSAAPAAPRLGGSGVAQPGGGMTSSMRAPAPGGMTVPHFGLGGQPQAAPQGGGITGAMSAPGYQGASVSTGFDPNDPYAVSRAQEADRQAAIDTMRQYQQGVGGSALARGLEGQAADLVAHPESVDDATQRQIEGGAIETQRAQEADLVRQLREDQGASGRAGTGAGVRQVADVRRQSGSALNQQLTDLAVARAMRKKQEQAAALQAAGGTLGGLSQIGGATASKIADIFNGTERDDQSLARQIFASMLGAGGGYGLQPTF
jgi:hypothetical protein